MHLPSVLQLFSALSLRLWCTTTTTIINANETDRLALLAIKSQLHDPLGASLRFINIADNGVQGEIPNELGNLVRLEKLILANNSFSGTIPTNLSLRSKLMLFFANRNILAGEIPAEIGNLFKLEKLSFCVIKLTGQLPASIQNLSSHLEADSNRNNFGGKIPESPGQLRSLFYLNVGGNQFSGMFLPVYNLSSLEMIYLHDNRLNGNLPPVIGAKLPNLRKIVIALNNFTGPLPDSFSNASNRERLELSYNQFRGKVGSVCFVYEGILCESGTTVAVKSMVWEASLPGDLCSFGVMLLEMFIRRRPTDNAFSEGLTLHEYAKITMQEKVMEIIDSSLKS
ncbi:putative receptor-like protein kinase At3g47110 [Citrus clementina]|uniref:putative receptor-like protein kinase At3g47110 n=1 Tax=Citrus clementina TaxID=85681 RepID=UPI000CED3696|nr:putative receptor-like protein kinase At3g47110 [Citrus x clementina]